MGAHVRWDDPESSFAACERAMKGMKGHKVLVLDYVQSKCMFAHTAGEGPWSATAQSIALALYHDGYIRLPQVDTLRRRVHDLHAMGLLDRIDCGSEPAQFTLANATRVE